MNNIISYLSPINIILITLFLVYFFDLKNEDKMKKYDYSIYDIINIFLFICLILTSLIIIESIFLKILNK